MITENQNAQLLAGNFQSVAVEFSTDQVDLLETETENGTFYNHTLTGEGVCYENGKPLLPLVSRFVIVPATVGLELEVEAVGGYSLPAMYPPLLCDDVTATSLIPSRDNGSLYPPSIAEASDPIVIRGVRMVKITVYPVQYDSENNQYVYNPNIITRLNYTDSAPVNPADHPDRKNRSREFVKFISALAINGDEVSRDISTKLSPYVGHYAIVAHDSAVDYIGDLIEWKRKSGYKVDIISLPDAIARANTKAVKDSIKALYNSYLNNNEDPFDQLFLVGDRSIYSWPPAAQWILEAETGETVWPASPHADYKYALLEGNDNYPDVGFSRFNAGSKNTLDIHRLKTLAYEATPYMDDTRWFTRGAVYFQRWGNTPESAWHISIASNIRWATETLKFRGITSVHTYNNYDHDQWGEKVGVFEADMFNMKSNLMLGRSESIVWGQVLTGIENNNVFPIRIAFSGHGEYAGWGLMRIGDAQNLKGPVINTANWGTPASITNSAVWMATISALVNKGMNIGWARLYATTMVETLFPNFKFSGVNTYDHLKTDIEFLGDPGIRAWLGVPRMVKASIPDSVGTSPHLVEVAVTSSDGAQPIANATVTLYAPGNIPAANTAQYAKYADMYSQTVTSDESGYARFLFNGEPLFVAGTKMFLTVTGSDIRPWFGEVPITQNTQELISLSNYSLTETEGNNDQLVNPGEKFNLFLSAKNNSNFAADDISATVTSLSPYVTVVGEGKVGFGAIGIQESAPAQQPLPIVIAPDCPDAQSLPLTTPVIRIQFANGAERYITAFSIDPVAPHIQLAQTLQPIVIQIGNEVELNFSIKNMGRLGCSPFTAELIPLAFGISITSDSANYPAIADGDSAFSFNEGFKVIGSPLAVPGTVVNCLLRFESETGFVDSSYVALQVGNPAGGAPLEPDGYGYICYDDTDVNWFHAPTYRWTEISSVDPNMDLRGTRVLFNKTTLWDDSQVRVVELPFTFSFYGTTYSSLTISMSGYLAPGNQPAVANQQNWALDKGIGGGAGMIAPHWDWLKFNADSAVYTCYDEANGRFIVEWYRQQHYSGDATELTFQAILYEPTRWAVETGDAPIVFQYKSISDVAGELVQDKDIPYASVGISSPDGNTGINYSFRNVLARGAEAITARRALKFVPSARIHNGVIVGEVLTLGSEDPVAGAVVSTGYGLSTISGDDGTFIIPNVVRDYRFSLTATEEDYADSSFADLMISEEDTLRITFHIRSVVSVDDNSSLPVDYRLTTLFPNPFNNVTRLKFFTETTELVTVKVYDLNGAEVAVLNDGHLANGVHTRIWNAEGLASGLYLVRITAGNRTETFKAVLVR